MVMEEYFIEREEEDAGMTRPEETERAQKPVPPAEMEMRWCGGRRGFEARRVEITQPRTRKNVFQL